MPEKKVKELLKKYLEGSATPDEEKLVDDWYNSLSKEKHAPLTDGQRNFFRNVYWKSIQATIHTSSAKSRELWPRAAAVAASVVLILGILFYAIPPGSSESRADLVAPVRNEIITNVSDTSMQVTLPDDSRVTLFPQSRLEYGDDFDVNQRSVTLSGEAFFDIVHNADRPFYVFANEVVTRVLGTSFMVTAYPEDQRITVAVKTGKVSVYTQQEDVRSVAEDEAQIILTPNQQAVYTKNDRKVSRMLVKVPQLVISDEEVRKIRFEGAPVSEIFEALEKMYNVKIDFEAELLSGCSITTSVSGNNLYERIDVICEIIGATYRVEDTTIRISGSGCK